MDSWGLAMFSAMPVLGVSFALLVAALYSALIMGASYANGAEGKSKRKPVYILRALVGGFLLVTGLLALSHVFFDFASMPPKIVFPLVVGFLGMLLLGLGPWSAIWIRQIPQSWLIGIQGFRLPVEIILFFLAKTPLLPKIMTFEGRNFDVITGITALILGHYLRVAEDKGKQKNFKRLIVLWNVMGLGLLINVMAMGLLSAPTQFQMLIVDHPNTIIAHMPFVWLPTFVVPFAGLLHILSLRKALAS
jgi:hypothetical protein